MNLLDAKYGEVPDDEERYRFPHGFYGAHRLMQKKLSKPDHCRALGSGGVSVTTETRTMAAHSFLRWVCQNKIAPMGREGEALPGHRPMKAAWLCVRTTSISAGLEHLELSRCAEWV